MITLPVELASLLSKSLKINFYKEVYGIEIEETDIELRCQLTLKTIMHPARTKSCKISCLCEEKLLEKYKVCSCGKQVDNFNPCVRDEVLDQVFEFVKKQFEVEFTNARSLLYNSKNKTLQFVAN